MEEIAYQNKDITSKLMAETLKGKSLAAFGLPGAKDCGYPAYEPACHRKQ